MDDKGKPEEEVEDFSKGPLSVLWHSVKNNTQVRPYWCGMGGYVCWPSSECSAKSF